MKKLFLFFVIFAISTLFPQNLMTKSSANLLGALNITGNEEKVLIWVSFTDKGTNISNLLAKPSAIVSDKALERRIKKSSAGKELDFTDLPINNEYIDELAKLGFEIKQKSKWFNSASGFIRKQQIGLIANLNFVKQLDLVAKFRKAKDVPVLESDKPIAEYIHQNQFNRTNPTSIESLDYGDSYPQISQIKSNQLHDMGFKGQNVVIALMDAGFARMSHKVYDSMHVIATYDFVNHRTYVGNDTIGAGEGTHGNFTLSAIGGYLPGKLIGPAYKSKYILCKTENTDSETPIEEDNWIAALEWSDSIGVDVTSTSLSYLNYDPPYASYTWQDMDGKTSKMSRACALAVKKGIVVCNSAGNNGSDDVHNTLGAPADADSMFAIGSVTYLGDRSSFSSVGKTVDGRIKPDFMAMGSATFCASVANDSAFTFASGTSLSCPIAAGLCAQLLSAFPNINPIQLRDVLRKTSSQSIVPDRFMGWGILNGISAYNNLASNVETTSQKSNVVFLSQNFPNPISMGNGYPAITNISFEIPGQTHVKLVVFDILGRVVKTLINEERNGGYYTIRANLSELPSGIYFYHLKTNNFSETKKLSIAK